MAPNPKSLILQKFDLIQTYRQPKPRTHKQIQIVFQNTAAEFHQQHFGKAIFVTFGLNTQSKRTIAEEWKLFVDIMPHVLEIIDQTVTTAGLLIGVELYQKTKSRANSKSFKPHAHMVIFAYNEFMALPNYLLSSKLIQLGLDAKVDDLPSPKDTANAMRYTIKSAGDPLTMQATQAFIGSPPTALYINTALQSNPLLAIEDFIHLPTIPISIVKRNLYWKVPSVVRHKDLKYSAALFLRDLCVQLNIGFYKDSLLKRTPGSYFTWQKWKPINLFIETLADAKQMPPSYKEFLLDNAPWIMKEGATNTTQPIHTVFPKVIMAPHLWEFQDAQVYNFCTDQCEPLNLTNFISCSKFIDIQFDQLPQQPTQLLNLINILTRSQHETFLLLKTLGGLFHQLTNSRKNQKALWVFGTNNTYKTTLVATFLEKCFHQQLIIRIQHSSSPFQFAALKGLEQGIVFVDDFRSHAFKHNAPEFINLVDGIPTQIQEKYKIAELVQFKGNFAITSNEPLADTYFTTIDKKAVDCRFQQVHFHEVQQRHHLDLLQQFTSLPDLQWHALAILANRVFLGQHSKLKALL